MKKGTLQDKGGRTLGKGPEATVTLPGCHSHSRTRVRAPLGTRLLPRLQRTLLPSRALWEGGPHREQCGWCFPKLKGQGRPKGCYGICVSRRWDRCLRTSEKSEKVILEFYVNWARLPTSTRPLLSSFSILRQEARPGPSLPLSFGRTELVRVHSWKEVYFCMGPKSHACLMYVTV